MLWNRLLVTNFSTNCTFICFTFYQNIRTRKKLETASPLLASQSEVYYAPYFNYLWHTTLKLSKLKQQPFYYISWIYKLTGLSWEILLLHKLSAVIAVIWKLYWAQMSKVAHSHSWHLTLAIGSGLSWGFLILFPPNIMAVDSKNIKAEASRPY